MDVAFVVSMCLCGCGLCVFEDVDREVREGVMLLVCVSKDVACHKGVGQ